MLFSCSLGSKEKPATYAAEVVNGGMAHVSLFDFGAKGPKGKSGAKRLTWF